MDKVIEVTELEDGKGCQTDGYMLEGGDGWYPTLFIRLVQDYGLDIDVSDMKPSLQGQAVRYCYCSV